MYALEVRDRELQQRAFELSAQFQRLPVDQRGDHAQELGAAFEIALGLEREVDRSGDFGGLSSGTPADSASGGQARGLHPTEERQTNGCR